MIITKTINSDLQIKGPAQEIHAVQGDCYTRKVTMRLLSNKEPWTPETPVSVTIRYCKPDGTGGVYDTLPNGEKAWELNKNLLSFLLAPQMITTPGPVSVQIELSRNQLILATFPFQVIVTENPSVATIPSEDYFNLEERLEERVKTAIAEVHASGGFTGATGATPQLQIGTVSTLSSGTPATAVIRGTAEYPFLDLGLPKGADAVIDNTLTASGHAADAKTVGDALAGKAPAGYGYGDVIKCYDWTASETSFNTNLHAIFSAMPDDCVKQVLCVDSSVSSALCTCTLSKSAPSMGVLSGTDIYGFRRQKIFNGEWQPWEWVNPPVNLGVEYRTTERWLGKTVFTKLIDCGPVPDKGTEKQVQTGIPGITYIVRCAGVTSGGASLPLNREGYGTISIMATPTEIILCAGANNASLSSWLSAYCQLWYTKD